MTSASTSTDSTMYLTQLTHDSSTPMTLVTCVFIELDTEISNNSFCDNLLGSDLYG